MIRLRLSGGSVAAAVRGLKPSDRRPNGRRCRRVSQLARLHISLARQVLPQAVVLPASWALGLLVAARIIPGVSVSLSGLITAVVVFAAMQSIVSLSILEVPRFYVPLLVGGSGLALTVAVLIGVSVTLRGIVIDGFAAWLATTVVVWLVTTVGAISLFDRSARIS